MMMMISKESFFEDKSCTNLYYVPGHFSVQTQRSFKVLKSVQFLLVVFLFSSIYLPYPISIAELLVNGSFYTVWTGTISGLLTHVRYRNVFFSRINPAILGTGPPLVDEGDAQLSIPAAHNYNHNNNNNDQTLEEKAQTPTTTSNSRVIPPLSAHEVLPFSVKLRFYLVQRIVPFLPLWLITWFWGVCLDTHWSFRRFARGSFSYGLNLIGAGSLVATAPYQNPATRSHTDFGLYMVKSPGMMLGSSFLMLWIFYAAIAYLLTQSTLVNFCIKVMRTILRIPSQSNAVQTRWTRFRYSFPFWLITGTLMCSTIVPVGLISHAIAKTYGRAMIKTPQLTLKLEDNPLKAAGWYIQPFLWRLNPMIMGIFIAELAYRLGWVDDPEKAQPSFFEQRNRMARRVSQIRPKEAGIESAKTATSRNPEKKEKYASELKSSSPNWPENFTTLLRHLCWAFAMKISSCFYLLIRGIPTDIAIYLCFCCLASRTQLSNNKPLIFSSFVGKAYNFIATKTPNTKDGAFLTAGAQNFVDAAPTKLAESAYPWRLMEPWLFMPLSWIGLMSLMQPFVESSVIGWILSRNPIQAVCGGRIPAAIVLLGMPLYHTFPNWLQQDIRIGSSQLCWTGALFLVVVPYCTYIHQPWQAFVQVKNSRWLSLQYVKYRMGGESHSHLINPSRFGEPVLQLEFCGCTYDLNDDNGKKEYLAELAEIPIPSITPLTSLPHRLLSSMIKHSGIQLEPMMGSSASINSP